MAQGLRIFPSDDPVFGAFVRDALRELAARGPRVTPDALQRAVRAHYPAAVVVEQDELARHGDDPLLWYVYRAGSIEGTRAHRWPAWAILDDDRRFLEVSTELAGIAEVPAEEMVGHRVEDFTNPADPTIRADIEALWREFVEHGSIAATMRFNFADGRPRELEYRLEAGAAGPGRHRLSVRERRR